jgi:hypothetical protein
MRGRSTLEYLLAFDGREHHYPDGYFVKFEIRRIDPTPERPHGLRYSFTLHDPDGMRLVGFDNAHRVSAVGGRFKKSRPLRITGTGLNAIRGDRIGSSAPNNWWTISSTRLKEC